MTPKRITLFCTCCISVLCICACRKSGSAADGINCTLNFSSDIEFTPSFGQGEQACLLQYCDLKTDASYAAPSSTSSSGASFVFKPQSSPGGGTIVYSAAYPASDMPSNTTLSIPAKQTVQSGAVDKSALIFYTEPLRYQSVPSDIAFTASPACAIVKYSFTNLAAQVGKMTLTAVVGGKATPVCGDVEIDPEQGELYSRSHTGALEVTVTGSSSVIPAVCHPFSLTYGDYLDIDLVCGGDTYSVRATPKMGKTLAVLNGAVSEVALDLAGVSAGAARKEVQFDPGTEDPKDKEHPYICMNSSSLTALKAAVSTQGGSSPVGKIHNFIIANADKSLSAADLTYSKPDGKRLLATSRTAEMQIISCAYAWRCTGSGQYLTRALKDLEAVCNFQDWNCKTHSLDAGEMAVAVGIGYDWLYEKMTDAQRTLAESALYRFAVTPFINAFGSGSYKSGYTSMNFLTAESNWNQVCCAGMVIAALALKDKYPDVSAKVISLCVEANKKIVTKMYDGGTYPEGYGYWSYGTDFQAVMNFALESVLGTDYGIYDIAGLPASARFFLYMESQFGSSFGYSDGSSNWAVGLPLWYFAYRSGDTDILYDEVRKLGGTLYSSSEDMRIMPLLMPCVASVKLSSVTAPTEKVFAEGTVQPLVVVKTGWAADQTTEYLGIKGGKANTSHGHMDAGSFVFDSQGVRWARDYGGGTYANFEKAATAAGKNYWNMGQSSFRWTVGIVNNRTHNTVTVNDTDYNVSASVALTGIQTANEMGAEMDLTQVLNGQVSKAVRTVKLVDEEDLYVIDEITALPTLDAKVDWKMLTPASYEIAADKIHLSRNSVHLYIRTQTSVDVEYKHFDSVVNSYDVNLDSAGYHLVGFTATVPKGQSVTFTTKLTKQ